jgi:hypothetical protein
MSLSLYDVSIAPLLRTLDNLSRILDKGEAYAKEKGIDPAVLIEARLAPDMRPLKNQIYLATDSAKGCAARLAGVDNPSFPDVENTFDDLRARLKKTADFLRSVNKDAVSASLGKTITMKLPSRTMEFEASAYVLGFVMPNVYFHVTTAYDILRAQGAPLGKPDYLGTV